MTQMGHPFGVHKLALLEHDVRASFFQFLLGGVGGILANSSKNLSASSLCHGLRFTETELGQLTNNLDDIDLLSARILDNYIEFSFLFDGLSSRGSRTGHGSHRHRCSRRDAPLLFQLLYEFSRLEDGQCGKLFHDLIEISSHCIDTP